jgi:hypothetical protein
MPPSGETLSVPPLHQRLRRGVRTASLSLLLLVALFYGIENERGALAWKRAQARFAAAGESLDLERFAPPSIPDAENFCATPALLGVNGDDDAALSSQRRLNALDFQRHRPRGFITEPASTRDPPDWLAWRAYLEPSTSLAFPPDEQDPAKAIVRSFAPHQALFDELTQAARDRPHARFEPPLYRNRNRSGIMGSLRGPSPVELLEDALRLKARACLAAGDTDQAGQLLRVLWRLRQARTHETNREIGPIAFVFALSRDAPVLLDGLRLRAWNEAQLAEWDSLLATPPILDQVVHSLRWSVADAVDFIERVLSDQSSAMDEWYGNSQNLLPPTFLWAVRLAPRGWLRQHQALAVNEFLDRMLPPLRDSGLLAWHQSELARRTVWEGAGHPPMVYSHLVIMSIQPNFLPLHCLFAEIDTRQLRTACALERYFLRHQHYPESLAALSPDLLAEIPSDLDGQPLHYARDQTNGRYRLWSVGENLVDDWHGQPPPPTPPKPGRKPVNSPVHALDWVLAFPADHS